MTAGGGKDASLGRGRTLAVPAFAEDDGTADPRVRHLLASSEDPIRLARALRSVRLLGCVIAVADEVDASGAEQSSHMAAVLMVNERGETGLLAFTGVDSLAAWNPQARPVPSLGREVARSALALGPPEWLPSGWLVPSWLQHCQPQQLTPRWDTSHSPATTHA
jgi:hypothetical protein